MRETGPFSATHVTRAIERLPRLSSKDVRDLLEKAATNHVDALADACRRELAIRPIELTKDAAERNAAAMEATFELDLAEVIHVAFRDVPPSDAELSILAEIAAEPGIGFDRLRDLTGMGDLGLAVGHLAHDRFGYFRRFLKPGEPQSNVLLSRVVHDGRVTYTLRPEAEDVFRAMKII